MSITGMEQFGKLVRVRVIPGARTESVEEIDSGVLRVHVHERPDKGRANRRVTELVALYYNVPKSSVVLARGAAARLKTFIVG